MAHQHLGRLARRMWLIAGATLAVVLLPFALPASAQTDVSVSEVCPAGLPALNATVGDTCELADGLVKSLTDVIDRALVPVGTAVGEVTALLDPVTGDLLPTGEAADALLPSVGGASASASADGNGANAAVGVEAAGKAATEVFAPAAPDADGRVAGLVPGFNIPGLRSQSGLTLQPFQPPIVSTPFSFDTPRVAEGQAAATGGSTAITLAGEVLLDTSSNTTRLAIAAGLGLLLATGLRLRSRRRRAAAAAAAA